MEFRRSGPCDQRRRRVLIDENLNTEAGKEVSQSAGGRRLGATSHQQDDRTYSNAAKAGRQPPLTGILAQRGTTLAILSLSMAAVLAGLVATYGQLRLWPAAMWPSRLTALDVQAPGSLAGWVCSLLLVAAGIQSIQIYRLRRHKIDDYRGRYRIWLWVPVMFFLLAASVATRIDIDMLTILGQLAALRGSVEPKLLGPVLYCVGWTLIALRMGLEMRASRAAIVLLSISTGCYFVVALSRVAGLPGTSNIGLIMLHSSLAMLGHLLAFLTVAVYGRFVYLDSQGLLAKAQPKVRSRSTRQKVGKTAKRKKGEDGDAEGDSAGTERPVPVVEQVPVIRMPTSADESPTAAAKRRGKPLTVTKRTQDAVDEPVEEQADEQAEEQADVISADFGQDHKLSKAERKRLRKQKRRGPERRAA